MNRKRQWNARAFSLVEVVIALGIVSFALVALIGLFGVGLNASKQATDDTEGASIGWIVMNQYRSGSVSAGTNKTTYYTLAGQLTTNTSEAYYNCVLTTARASSTSTDPDYNLIKATANITWPYTVTASKRPFTNIIYATFPPK